MHFNRYRHGVTVEISSLVFIVDIYTPQFNQTHTQALQTQIQAVQILLDKQATIIAAVLPLLPLLQTVPLHIDTLKATMNETLTNFLSSRKTAHGVYSSLAVQELSVSKLGKRTRADVDKPHSVSPTPSMATPSRKKIRTDNISSNSPSKIANIDSSPIQRAPLSAIRSITTGAQNSSRRNENNAISIIGISPGHISDKNALLSSGSRRGTFAIPELTTPRRPLGDLPVPSSRLAPSINRSASILRPTASEMPLERSSTLGPGFSLADLPGLTPTAARPPRILRVHTSFTNANNSKKDSLATAGSAADSNAVASSSVHRQPSRVFGPPIITAGLQQQNLKVKGESLEDLRPFDAGNIEPLPTLASAGLEILSVKPKGMFGKARRSPTVCWTFICIIYC